MIITKLIGGLGNQMFQYAAGLKVATDLKTQLKLDINSFANEGVTRRSYELEIFNISGTLATIDEVSKLKLLPGKTIQNFPSLINIIEKVTRKSHVTDSKKQKNLNIPNNSYLEGNWNSEDYFKDVEKQIRKEFKFKRANLPLLSEIKGKSPVSLHIRRGDYINNKKVHDYYEHCSLTYYEKAIQIVKSKIKHPTFYLFSDDPGWVKKKFLRLRNATIISGNSGADDLYLMSKCKHHIIANSSFSWWGAWLNPDKSKLVISPKKWFRDKSHDHGHLVPSGWMKI